MEVICSHFDDFKPTHSGVNHCHAGDTNRIINDSTARLILYYRLNVWTQQVHMYCIPRLQFLNILMWQTSINSLSLFELLTFLARLRIQLYLYYKTFTIEYLSNCFIKHTTTWVVQIEMVPIQHTSAQSLRYMKFSIIAYYFDFIKNLLGVTGYPIQNVCSEFRTFFSSFCCSLCKLKRFTGRLIPAQEFHFFYTRLILVNFKTVY